MAQWTFVQQVSARIKRIIASNSELFPLTSPVQLFQVRDRGQSLLRAFSLASTERFSRSSPSSQRQQRYILPTSPRGRWRCGDENLAEGLELTAGSHLSNVYS